MPAAPKFYDHLISLLRAASLREQQDSLLDIWIDASTRATEWDADQWGFAPDKWCAQDRRTMEERIAAATAKKPTVEQIP